MSTLGLLSALMKREFRRLASDLLVYSDFSSGILFYLFCRFVETGVTNEIADSRGG